MFSLAALFVLSSLSVASTGSPGFLLPGAADLGAGHGYIGGGVAGVVPVSDLEQPVVGPRMDAEIGVTDRLALRAGMAYWSDVFLVPSLTARYQVLDRDGLNLAPWVGSIAFAGVDYNNDGLLFGLGFAAEGGWERVRLDGSLTLLGLGLFSEAPSMARALIPPPWSLAVSELGVSALFGDHHRLRGGMTSFVPSLGYRYDGERLYAALDLGVAGGLAMFGSQLGVRF